jgi:N-acetylmuramic acid 6-phosphate etherase
MKAGTATKLVLNTLTTGAMVRLGKTYGNLMVDLQASNAKLVARSLRILQRLSSLDAAAAAELLARCDGELKTAIVVARLGTGVDAARQRLAAADGRLRLALGDDA